MSEMQSHDRFQFWEHFDDAKANTEILMKSIMIFKFSPARRRLRISRFGKLNMPEKQSCNRVHFWKHFDVASILIED